MTPGEVREQLVTIQTDLRKLETVIEVQKSANVGYCLIGHEMTEAWEAVDRAIEECDEMAMGVT